MAWFYFFGNPAKTEAPATTQDAAATTAEMPAPAVPAATSAPAVLQPILDTAPLATPEVVRKENAVMNMTWTTQGGTLSSLELKNFTGRQNKNSDKVQGPVPVNLVPFERDRALTLLCDLCNQALPREDRYRIVSQDDTMIAFEAQQDNLKVTKIYQWNPNQYLFHLKIILENKGGQEFKGRLGLGWQAQQYPKHPKSGLLGFLNQQPEDQKSLLYKADTKVLHGLKSGETREVRGLIPWAGIEDRYFLTALISRQMSHDQTLKLESLNDSLKVSLFPSESVVVPQGRQEMQYTIYLGPKQRTELEAVGAGLEEAVDYGWFGVIAVPILKLLQFFHGWVKNWGLAVIVLTIFIKIITNPLTIKSMKQMKAMQNLQPQLQALKEKYKDDKQRLNMETMALFKKNQVNPMGGCLPMLMQMPIYIALYKVIYNAIELYHAPFFGFYKDLSAPDPYFILPILLGVAMLLQQKFTPSPSVDPTQKQMMMIMPIMFTAFMLFLPVGLVLYIFINTGMSVLQQWMHQKDIRWRDVFRGKFKPAV